MALHDIALAAQITKLEAERDDLAAQLAVAVEALEGYGDTYCEGWCEDGPHFEFADCGGCPARKALASLPERTKALREVVEAWRTMTATEREYVIEHLRSLGDQERDLGKALAKLEKAR